MNEKISSVEDLAQCTIILCELANTANYNKIASHKWHQKACKGEKQGHQCEEYKINFIVSQLGLPQIVFLHNNSTTYELQRMVLRSMALVICEHHGQ